MKSFWLFAVILGTINCSDAALAAGEKGIQNAYWCSIHPEDPTQLGHWDDMAPDGWPRAARSAAHLFVNAQKALVAGRDNEAIDWLLLCQAHNPSAQDDIKADRGAVLEYLRTAARPTEIDTGPGATVIDWLAKKVKPALADDGCGATQEKKPGSTGIGAPQRC